MRLEAIRFFPFKRAKKSLFCHEAIIGVGGNVGHVKRRFVKLYRYLQSDRRLRVIQTSPILHNPAFGYVEQNDFCNALMHIQTSLHVKALLKILLHVETLFGRKRVFKNGPRTLDLDIIFFDNLVRNQKHISLPHPHWEERLSVIIPLVMLQRSKG